MSQWALGERVSCVLLSTGKVKCWGEGNFGATGQGNKKELGDDPNEMGDNLTHVDLGAGQRATAAPSWLSSPMRVMNNKLPSSGGLLKPPTPAEKARKLAGCPPAPVKTCPCCASVGPGVELALVCPQNDLYNADLRNANLEGAILEDVNLACAVFDGAQLKGAEFKNARGAAVSFRNAKMENAQVGETSFTSPDFTGAHIRAASFELTVSPGAIFDGANIDGTDFKSASLDRASWKGTTGIMSALFEMATGALPPGVSTANTG